MYKVKVLDIIVIVCLLLTSFVPLLFFGEEGGSALVYVNGEKAYTISLNVDSETVIEGVCTVVVKDGKVSVCDAECPDKLCEKSGEIYREGESIVCIPEGIVIKISGEGEVDGVAK